jgi:hypothetical protein
MNPPERYIFGFGTGRCGTVSLARVLQSQDDTRGFHECEGFPEIIPYTARIEETGLPEWLRKPRALEAWKPEPRVCRTLAFVAPYLTPHINDLLLLFPNSVAVCMWRDEEAVVRSYLKKANGRDHWRSRHGNPSQWDAAFPKFDDALTTGEAIRRYWRHYSEIHGSLAHWYPGRVFDLRMEDMNSDAQLTGLLQRLGYERPVLPHCRHYNESPDTQPALTTP